jgi:branched-chain amino acid transport system substrate-binding protein
MDGSPVSSKGGIPMFRQYRFLVVVLAMAVIGAATVAPGIATAQSNKAKKTLHIIGAYERQGESTLASNNFDDGARLGVEDLEKQGWDVTYERIPSGGTNAAQMEQAFLAAQAKNPDALIGLTSSNTFIPVGPKVAATDLPTFATASPTEGVKTGPSGGDNIFLLRPLNEQTYEKALDYACQTMKMKKIGLTLVNTAFGPTAQGVIDRNISKYPGCKVVTSQTNSATATDMTQQALAFKNAEVDGIISANFPGPIGVLVNQLRQNGVNVPVLGGATLNLAKEANSITSLQDLVVVDDCVPDLDKTKQAKKFVKAYNDEFGYVPNYASAQVYDAVHMAANAVAKAGHDPVKINKALAGTQYDGVCDYTNDKNNVLAQSVTFYRYNDDGSKKFLKTYQLDFVPNEELGAVTTVAPTTTRPAG